MNHPAVHPRARRHRRKWIDWPSMKLARSIPAKAMALKGRDLCLVPEDGPTRLFHFRFNNQEPDDTVRPVKLERDD